MKNTSKLQSAQGSVRELGGRLTGMGEKVSGFVAENADAARERIAAVYESAKDDLAVGVKTVRARVRKHPLRSLAIAAGIGVALGALSTLVVRRR